MRVILYPYKIKIRCASVQWRRSGTPHFLAVRGPKSKYALSMAYAVLPTVAKHNMHADFCSTLGTSVDFIRLFDCINCSRIFGSGWAGSESPREGTWKGRKENWRRERGGLDSQDLEQIAATACVRVDRNGVVVFVILVLLKASDCFNYFFAL